MKHTAIAAVLLGGFLLSSCSGMEVRDRLADTSRTVYAAGDAALHTQIVARQKWREGCAALNAHERKVLDEYIEAQETAEDKLAAIDLAKERHNKALPRINTIDALTDGDGSLLSAVNKVTC